MNPGVPYQGSKNRIAPQIVDCITKLTPKYTTYYDVFAGGMAIAIELCKRDLTVYANDLNKYVIAFVERLFTHTIPSEVYTKPEFIHRSEFFAITEHPEEYPDWYVGFAQCIWSFGNNQRSYMYGLDKEDMKTLIHDVVVNQSHSSLTTLNTLTQTQIPFPEGDTWDERRLRMRQSYGNHKDQNDTALSHLCRINLLKKLEATDADLSQIHLSSKDYRDLEIPSNCVVYCDPPYAGTSEYSEGGFNSSEFWTWASHLSETNPVFVSEERAPDDWIEVIAIPKHRTLQGGAGKLVLEKVFAKPQWAGVDK